jgi:hypothetical protein
MPYVGISEQAEAQKIVQALQEQIHMAAGTATGQGEDFDMEAMNEPMPEEQGPPIQ